MDRRFDDFAGGFGGGSLFAPSAHRRAESAFAGMPAVDVAETDKGYEITAELPGMDEKNIEVKLANGVLSIKGEKQGETEEKDKNYYRRERSFGSFERSFHVPDNVDAEKIEATFKNGDVGGDAAENSGGTKPGQKDRCKDGLDSSEGAARLKPQSPVMV